MNEVSVAAFASAVYKSVAFQISDQFPDFRWQCFFRVSHVGRNKRSALRRMLPRTA